MDIFKGGYIFYFLGKKNMYECLYRMYGMAQWFFWIRYICFQLSILIIELDDPHFVCNGGH